MRAIPDAVRRARLARRHLLLPDERRDDVPAIADALVAMHSSDPVTVYLSLAARSNALEVADVERALYDDRSVLRHHAMRRTLWVTTPEIGEYVHAMCTRKIAATERSRSAALVGDPEWFDAAVAQVIRLVEASPEPLSTRQVGELLPDLRRDIVYGDGTRHRATGSAHTRATLVAAFDGALIRGRPAGTWIGSQYAWADTRRWCGIDWDRHDTDTAATMVVHAWLARFGPGTLDDIVWWSGTTKTMVRRALAELDVDEVELSTSTGFALAADIDDESDEPWAALLPGLDPTPMGWKHRSWYLDEATAHRVVDRFGNIGPTVWADGRIVGGWAQRPDGELRIELTHELGRDHQRLVDVEAERLRAFIGDTRFKVRFPSPNQPELLA